MMRGRKLPQSSQEETDDDDDEVEGSLSPEGPPTPRKKKSNKSSNKRRFSDEQVRSLETIFESETKLEPRKKVEVARELGLQPRQVAIWFQNKRARWKSKQIEKNYRILKASYDGLKSRYEDVKREKECLFQQLQELHAMLEKSQEGSKNSKDFAALSRENRDAIAEELAAKSSSLEEEMVDHQGVAYSDDDKSGNNMSYLGQDEPQLLNMSGSMGAHPMIPPIKWCSFDAGSLFDQSNTSSHWWDSWI